MKVFCQYSGITFEVENFPNFKLDYVHPIFSASPKHLLSRAGDWAAQRFNEKESRLLFLSLLHTTELVEFRTAATPEHSTVQKNMEAVLRFVAWQSGLTNPSIVFPKFAITLETKTLGNVKHWLQVWQEAKDDFENGYRSTSIASRLRIKEAALERLIKSSQRKTEDYAGLLATWAMDASDAPASIREFWVSLFKLKGLAIYNCKAVDLTDLVEHLEDRLEHGSIFSAACMQHVRRLAAMNKAGLGYSLGMPMETLEGVDLLALSKDPFTIVEDEIETYNRNIIAATAPDEEPLLKDYPSKVAWLRAKAAFVISQRAKVYAAEFTSKVETAVATDAEDARIFDDDALLDTAEIKGTEDSDEEEGDSEHGL